MLYAIIVLLCFMYNYTLPPYTPIGQMAQGHRRVSVKVLLIIVQTDITICQDITIRQVDEYLSRCNYLSRHYYYYCLDITICQVDK